MQWATEDRTESHLHGECRDYIDEPAPRPNLTGTKPVYLELNPGSVSYIFTLISYAQAQGILCKPLRSQRQACVARSEGELMTLKSMKLPPATG